MKIQFEGEKVVSLRKYLADNRIDQIEDDQEFMESEYNAVQTYCEIIEYLITDDDLETIKSRGLEESFINWKETYLKDLWEELGEVPMNPETEENIMSRYGISVMEILKRTVIVEAENLEEAIQKVKEAVEREEIILDVDDYDDREIIPSEYFEDGKVPEGKDVSFYWHIG